MQNNSIWLGNILLIRKYYSYRLYYQQTKFLVVYNYYLHISIVQLNNIFPGHRAHTVYVGVHVPGGPRRHSRRRKPSVTVTSKSSDGSHIQDMERPSKLLKDFTEELYIFDEFLK